MDAPGDPDTLDRKVKSLEHERCEETHLQPPSGTNMHVLLQVREDTLDLPARPPFLCHQVLWRKEILDTLEATGSPASLDPEVTRLPAAKMRPCVQAFIWSGVVMELNL